MAFLIDDEIQRDDRFRKLRLLPNFADAFAMYALVGVQCASEKNDGRLYRSVARGLLPVAGKAAKALEALVGVGFLVEDESADEYVFVRFTKEDDGLNESHARKCLRLQNGAARAKRHYERTQREKANAESDDEPNALGDASSDAGSNTGSNDAPSPFSLSLDQIPPTPQAGGEAKPTKTKKPRAEPQPTNEAIAKTIEARIPSITPIDVTTKAAKRAFTALRRWSNKQPEGALVAIDLVGAGAASNVRFVENGCPLGWLSHDPDAYARRARRGDGTPPRDVEIPDAIDLEIADLENGLKRGRFPTLHEEEQAHARIAELKKQRRHAA